VFESDDEKDINSQTNELITDVKATLNETSKVSVEEDDEVSAEEDDKEDKPGLFERMRTSSADRRTGRINRRVDELTGTDVDTRKKMADGFLPTDYVRIDGEGRAEFNLKVDKEDELNGWDYYRLELQDNEHFQQLDNLGKARWLTEAEKEYKATTSGKNYAKGTYLAELNREELLEQNICLRLL
jgi:hypothetical protein